MRGVLPAVSIAIGLAAPRPVSACASCACGDPTITTIGAGKPFAGRLRASMLYRHRSSVSGTTGVDAVRADEDRADLGVSLSVLDDLVIEASIPLVLRRATLVNLARSEVMTLGDAELRARAFLFEDRTFNPRHLLAVHGGAVLPSAPAAERPTGERLPLEAQAGTGSVQPLAGLSYAYFDDPVSLYASTTVVLPIRGRFDARVGTTVLASAFAQLQPWSWLALRLGVDGRWAARSEDGGRLDPDSGGFIAFLAPALVLSPLEDLVVHASVGVPVLRALNGVQEEHPTAEVGVVYDF